MEKKDKNYKRLLKYLPQLVVCLAILGRISRFYPYILSECATDEELKTLWKEPK